MVSHIDWHFTDYPKDDEVVICKPTNDEPIFTAVWDKTRKVWMDVGRDYSTFRGGVACWGSVRGIPETTKEMEVR